jgi:hypothetical protein
MGHLLVKNVGHVPMPQRNPELARQLSGDAKAQGEDFVGTDNLVRHRQQYDV